MLDCCMQISVERLRVRLLAGAGVLVLATAAFLGYVRFSGRQDIRRETNAFTYSQTVKGRTRFTVHAAKAIQHSDGKYTLHDAEIVLYDQDGENRRTRCIGSTGSSLSTTRIRGAFVVWVKCIWI
jgi:lipopolysaccharide export system protein LptA